MKCVPDLRTGKKITPASASEDQRRTAKAAANKKGTSRRKQHDGTQDGTLANEMATTTGGQAKGKQAHASSTTEQARPVATIELGVGGNTTSFHGKMTL